MPGPAKSWTRSNRLFLLATPCSQRPAFYSKTLAADRTPSWNLLREESSEVTHVTAEIDSLRALMKKFANVPMSLADACLVRMTELDQKSVVLTLDRDFGIYRRNRRQVVPTISPRKRG